MKNIDLLFITPLGWDKHIWSNIATSIETKNKNIEYIEYKGNNPKEKQDIYDELFTNMKTLTEDGVVVCASYGTVAFLNFFKNYSYKLKKIKALIILEGLAKIPNVKILKNELLNNHEKTIYKSKEEYIENELVENEFNYIIKKELLLKNLKSTDNGYELITTDNDIFHYLSIFSEIDNKEILNSIIDKFEKIVIYSSEIDNINSYKHIILHKNEEENHLIMLEKEQEIKRIILENLE